jgi:hypothetical protein
VNDFDASGLYAAMDAQRMERGLSWRQVADEIWTQSVVLNERRKDHQGEGRKTEHEPD